MLGTIARASNVLELFVAGGEDWGVTEVATALELPKSNAHEILSSLAQAGLLQRSTSGRYRLGWRLLTLTGTLVRNQDLHRSSAPLLRGLCGSVSAVVAVAVWDGAHVVRMAQYGASTLGELSTPLVGERLPVTTSAEGLMLLAHAEQRAAVAPVQDEAGTPDSVLDGRLERIRSEGVAEDVDGISVGLSSVAAPVWSAAGEVVAALSIVVPSRRYALERDALRRSAGAAAARLSLALRGAAAPVDRAAELAEMRGA
ncbi:MAG TPA: IclR family transcriptional regulator C-terminal domain-containing protein [Marmoricola sp.]|nr:IclR family transcriptional regulator C-terminal domain-containing protein [Marmoricola sp.]